MNSAATFYPALQVIAALLVFVAVYLALALLTVLSLVAAELISEHTSLAREYGAKDVPFGTRTHPQLSSERLKSFRQYFPSRP